MWLHSSVGRASHRYRGGHGFESLWSPDFFQASSFQLLKLEIYCNDYSSLLYICVFQYLFFENEPAYLPFPPSRVPCPRMQPYFYECSNARWDVYCSVLVDRWSEFGLKGWKKLEFVEPKLFWIFVGFVGLHYGHYGLNECKLLSSRQPL